jgi:hypothetical protein
MFSPQEDLHATSAVSQQLVEKYAKNSSTGKEAIPEWARKVEDVFNQESFNSLLEHQTWDHTIELVLDSKPANCKVYPISPLEQHELNASNKECLATSRIRPSKSPIVSPLFSVKKKDGGLWFMQDYRALNTMTMKNQYPLPLINDLINRLKGALTQASSQK